MSAEYTGIIIELGASRSLSTQGDYGKGFNAGLEFAIKIADKYRRGEGLYQEEGPSIWLPVGPEADMYPDVSRRVQVLCRNMHGRRYVTIATYVPFMSIEEEEFMDYDFWGDGDYDEETDVFYTPEGWYEVMFAGEGAVSKISDIVEGWAYLPPIPSSET